MRIEKHGILWALLSVTAGAAAEDGATQCDLIPADTYYSAFDGEHDYRVELGIRLDPDADDPIDRSTVVWAAETGAVKLGPNPSLPAGVEITTLRAGTSTLKVRAKTKSGRVLTDEATLVVSETKPVYWEAGDSLLNDEIIRWKPLPLPASCQDLMLPSTPSTAGNCPSCHNTDNGIHVPMTTNLSTLSDDQLVGLFAQGTLPKDYELTSPFLRNLPEDSQACMFRALHAWNIPKDLELALLFRLRGGVESKPAVDATAP